MNTHFERLKARQANIEARIRLQEEHLTDGDLDKNWHDLQHLYLRADLVSIGIAVIEAIENHHAK